MGGIEDAEPPLKRVKVPSGESEKSLDNSSYTESISNPLGDSMARLLYSQGDGERVGPKGVIKKNEFVKIITRALYSLGYDRTGALLQEESGIQLHSSAVSLFMQQVLDGKWSESLKTLHTIGLSDESIVKSASFLILEQKFLELLKEGKLMDALGTLRNEIVPLSFNTERVHELASCIISPSQTVVFGHDNIGANPRSRFLEKLGKLLPAAVMIPERRLEHLLEQALDVQRHNCVFHNTPDSELSLLSDHLCGKNQIPSRTLKVLHAHEDEVWFLQFSHNGKYLASSSKDQLAIIWEVKDSSGEVVLKHRLTGHQKPVLTVSWSPDDNQLLTCGLEEAVRQWDVNSGECLHIYERRPGIGLVSCGWFPDGKGVVSGMTDKGICLWDIDGRELECWKGQRTIKMSDMAITDDGKRIISICGETAILLLDREAKFERLIEEEEMITSFSLSKDNKFLLVNLINQEIHLWSIEGDVRIVSKYKGHRRTRFVIRSCFGGFEQAFIASGSEDSQVYIWHRGTGELISALPGHSGAVNSVSWNPRNPHMLASASDDHTIRIWGLDDLRSVGTHSNGIVHLCNGRA
ncbi:WD repeat-containing protein 26 homolog [Diospyros lotus]|uniref:WD repeat-containing protein 26 homolog n=1 Tax=Diospyros lotus TaxID=55363 RepID=UPI0022507314|nr:WD repeat-containing protein 26 homolog [Diospyros lotus]XP_052205826.1 WD repeat-containing protein 26 homolog [Diospyros lotus]XP_052205828.1 WD repeat-containing protein 26 homolog [Diospyros lotus]XP_052205829.1 WD repeat-containing protein 26 homolog [Diospyros lotus]XP_052205830.1 WD repeat-containing protein 26 homolog [Diospyros lotus]